jgi:hypothetical protein
MSTKTPAEMSKFLASPDVAVTNKKDKTTMLPIVGKTDEHVREIMSGMHSVIPESHGAELRNPMVMEREGMGNAPASEPTPRMEAAGRPKATAKVAPAPPPELPARLGLKLEGGSLEGDAAEYMVSCRFWMIKADFLRTFSGKNLPFFQELRAKHPSAFVEVTISYEEVVRGTHVEKILSISHRWMEPTQPDPDGEQLKAIKAFLVSSAGKRIELLWIDGGSMPQDQPGLIRSVEDKADFDIMLSQVCAALCLGHRPFLATLSQPLYYYINILTPRRCSPPFTCAKVNMLYLGTTVLILFDLSYLSRFWTQFEAWLSMQFATPNGLKSAVGTKNARYHIVCIQNAAAQAELYTKALVDTWANKTPQQAHDILSKPDVTVTNQSDKLKQLPKIMKLDATMQGAFQAVMEREGLAGFDELHVQIPERASSASEPFYQGFHPGISCHRSGMIPIVGMRFNLRGSEPSYDLCQAEYDKLDDAEKGLYEAIPPPPSGLKLEGGSLPVAAAEYMGGYRLVVGKLVNGQPAYQHTSDATCWITFTGNGWMGQPESSLGKGEGHLDLEDPAAASPDVSTVTWKASGGAGAEWVEAPQLKCTAWTPPPLPPGLKLEGGPLPGEAAKYPGTYRLVVGKLVNGRPAYQHVTDASRWIAFDGNGWNGQPESVLGQGMGSLYLTDPAAASPDVSTKTWKASGGADNPWVEAPQLKCTACTPPPPPPPGLKLEGGSLEGDAAAYMGGYRLYSGKLVNGRPAYQHTSDATLWITFDGAIWRGQPGADLGQKSGPLLLPDEAAATPDVSAATWLCGWAPQPQLKCIPWTPPPLSPGLKLEGGSLEGAAAEYMGGYRLDRSKLVNGRPAYQHVADGSHWLAFDGAIWRGQPEASLGQKRGFLQLQDAAAATPDASAATWLAEQSVQVHQHEHILKLYRRDRGYTCNVCRSSFSAGHSYCCSNCNFDAYRDDYIACIACASQYSQYFDLAAQPQLKCTPCTPPPPPGLKLEGGSLEGAAAEYMGGYRLYSGKLVNGRPAWRHTAHFTCWLAFDGAIWRGQSEAYLGQKSGPLLLLDTAALTPDASSATWQAWKGTAWAAQPQLKCIPCTPPPPPGLKLEGGSLEGAAAEYMGEYRLAVDDRVWPFMSMGPSMGPHQAGKAGWRRGWRDGPMLVNGRPAWRHTTNLTCWLAFDGANWRGQPEADLGQERGVLLLSDAAALSPDASSATWLAANGPGSAGAAQPQIKCIPCAAPPLSRVELVELPVKNFRGPCAARCKPLAPCCCVSADGEAIFGCVPTDRHYILPACLHMALCPQLGCDPKGGDEDMISSTSFDQFIATTLFLTPFGLCIQEVPLSAINEHAPW